MEHRLNKRENLKEQVEIWRGNQKCGTFKVANICGGGIFVENCGPKIGSSQVVTVKFKDNPNLSYQPSKQALVIHQNPDGVGLMWTYR